MVEWLPVCATTACCDIVVRSLEYCREHKGLAIHAWVILDHHLHAILAAPDLSAVLRDLKSFTAKQLVQQIKLERREWLLHQLRHYRAAHKPNEYQIWQEGSHPQRILHDEMMEQSRAERIAVGAVGGGGRHKQTEGGASARRVPPEGGINRAYLHNNPVKRGWVSEPEH